jgi:hypothetical protein
VPGLPSEQTNYSTPAPCSPRFPCSRFRVCDYCAARRQRNYADIAERIEAAFGKLTLARITPDDPNAAALIRAKNAAMRYCTSPAMIWSIEIGDQQGKLHLNILGPNLDFQKPKNCTSYSEELTKPARAAAAYITKRKSIPDPMHFEGRVVGTAGTIMQWLTRATELPVAQGAALMKVLETAAFTSKVAGDTSAERVARLNRTTADMMRSVERAEKRAAQAYRIDKFVRYGIDDSLQSQHDE